MRPVLFIAVLLLTVAPIGVGQEQSARGSHRTSVEETIRKLDNERIQGQIHADATALDRIYAADFIGVGPSGTVRTKPQVILDFTSGDLRFQSITTDDVQVRVYGNTERSGLAVKYCCHGSVDRFEQQGRSSVLVSAGDLHVRFGVQGL